MPIYRAPVDDYRFVFNELLEVEKHRDLPDFEELSPDLLDDILTNAGKFCEEVLQPINQSGDEEGAHFENGVVRTPKGFKEAYKAYSEAGWGGLGAPTKYGGAGMPKLVAMAVAEMANAANQSFSMYPGLTGAAAGRAGRNRRALDEARTCCRRWSSGEWCGTMCLTEPHCGTDLRLMKTKAVEQPDGTYRMTGTKIFISGGDHDLTDNIIHMVIAKIPDENGQIARRSFDRELLHGAEIPRLRRRQDGREERRLHRRHRKEDGHQGAGDLRAELRRCGGLAAGAEADAAQARREAPRLGRHGRHVRHDEQCAAWRRHPGHLGRRGRLSERGGLRA